MLSDAPREGDIVAYFRDLQDVDGKAQELLEEKGVTCVWAEGLVSHELSDEIDTFHDQYLQNWHRQDVDEGACAEDEVFPYLLGYLYPVFYNTGMIIRLGEIIRRLLDAYPDSQEILTDLEDGRAYFDGTPDKKKRLLRKTVLARMANDRGLTCRQIKTATTIPVYRSIQNDKRILPMLWRWIGGLRWGYFLARLNLKISGKPKGIQRAYLFLNHGMYHLGNALIKMKGMDVRCDRTGYAPMRPLRYDHFFAIPRLADLKNGWGQHRRAAKGWTAKFTLAYCTFNGIDYSSYLLETRREMLREMLLPAIIIFSQIRRMLKVFEPDCVILNGEGNIPARSVISLARNGDFKAIFVRHGFNTYSQNFYPMGYNNPHVVYVVHGTDHLVEYGTHLPDSEKPRRVLASNPGLTEMVGLRDHYQKSGKGRVLALGFSAAQTQTVTRVRSFDRYTIDLFTAARKLIDQGITFSYRPHPSDNIEYITYALDQMGLTGQVEIETSPTFRDAILEFDVVISNVTSCHYQALFAGWPTIFYEPDFVRRRFIGLPAAADIDSPIAQTPNELVAMVNEALDPDSAVARFPGEFATTYAPRFLGPEPMNADKGVSGFVVSEIEQIRNAS